jgi:prepilin-type N-terminal cleavage/methylation domain-containing protein
MLMHKRRRAYTLFELVMVLAIAVSLAAITFPSLEAMYGDSRVTAAVDAVRAAWALGRAQAVNEGRAYRFAVVRNQGNYRVAPDASNYWTGDTPAPDDPANPPLIQEETLPKGVRFSSVDNSGDSSTPATPAQSVSSGAWSTVVTFLPDGTASQDVELVFQARGTKPVKLALRGFTSVVTVRQLP